jgi:type I restriction enzyme S subunit
LFVRITNLRRSDIHLDLSNCRFVKLPLDASEAKRTKLVPGDLLVSITADIGIIGYVDDTVPSPAYINQHIARVRFDPRRVSSKFVAYYLSSWEPQRAFVGMTDTGAKAGMNLTMVGALETVVPPLPEQRRIAEALDDVDEQLRKHELLLAKKRAIKVGVMQRLLAGKSRLPGFTRHWQVRRLADLLSYEQPGRFLVRTTKQLPSGRVPVLTAGKTFLLGYTNETHGVYRDHPVVIFDDFTTASQYVDFDFKAKSSAMKILSARPGADLRFVFERMQLIQFPVQDHKRYWISEYSQQTIEVPDLDEQQAIAAVAHDCDYEIRMLRARLAKARAMREGMMQALLSGRKRLRAEEEA